jgi:hypothetical protein
MNDGIAFSDRSEFKSILSYLIIGDNFIINCHSLNNMVVSPDYDDCKGQHCLACGFLPSFDSNMINI